MSTVSGIQGQLLEVTVIGCNKLKDTEWISRQDPYVCIEYGRDKSRTRTCTDGGKNPTFQEKFSFTLIEGLRELKVVVWNSNTLTRDDLIGSGNVQLQKVLSQGYDDSAWPIQSKNGRYAGEVRLILHYSSANKPATSYAPSAPLPHAPLYSIAPQAATGAYPFQPPYPAYPSNSTYPSGAYPPPPQAAYAPPAYPPTSAYPSPAYPSPPQPSTYHPSGPFPGLHFRPPPQ